MLKTSAALLFTSLLAGLLVALVNTQARYEVALRAARMHAQALRSVLPSGLEVSGPQQSAESGARIWTAKHDTATAAFAVESVQRGFCGPIRMLVGADTSGRIIGIEVLEHRETPALGGRISQAKAPSLWRATAPGNRARSPWFLEQFRGLSLVNRLTVDTVEGDGMELDKTERAALRERNAVCAITGATTTTRAVLNGLQAAASAHTSVRSGGPSGH